MIDVQLIRIKVKSGFATGTFETSEDVVFEMANKGYSYQGYLPIKIGAYGNLIEYDLVFERKE